MEILEVEHIRQWDAYTIGHEPISSLLLMERAASACFDWLMNAGYRNRRFFIFCGKGNNGGDGLVMARLLIQSGHEVTVHILEFGNKGTQDFQLNLQRLHEITSSIIFISSAEALHEIPKDAVIIDALYGSGLNKPLEGLSAELARHINNAGVEAISIDIPSGMFADSSSQGHTIVEATHTLSFQCYKLAFVMAENARWMGNLHILDIGLHPAFLKTIKPVYRLIDQGLATSILKKRNRFAHKGHFGHAALVAGSKGMMGAAVLAARSCLRSGVGKLNCHLPQCGYIIMQTSVPEAIVVSEPGEEFIEKVSALDRYDAIAIGPGWGMRPSNTGLIAEILATKKPIVIDADALNSIAQEKDSLNRLPANSILSPHPKEFERLFGAVPNDFYRLELLKQKANALQAVIVLKGHHTAVATPGGICYFNMSGNVGLAKGGSGDVLTGMLLALLAQGYPAEQAACLGVYLHGLAADLAAKCIAYESMLASDVVDYLGAAFQALY
jgi:NAD(P)H-hydrate epimerase